MIFKEMQNLCGHLLTEVPSGWFLACKSAARGSSTTCERRRVFTNFNHENARSSSQDETGGQKASRTNSHCPVLLLQLRLHLLSACPGFTGSTRSFSPLLVISEVGLQRKEIVGRWLGRGGWEEDERGGRPFGPQPTSSIFLFVPFFFFLKNSSSDSSARKN